MGFYGNITNTSKIQFTFDKTYQNRKSMEENMATDNVYIGRYVLVDYDLNFPGKNYARLYMNDGKFYFSPNFEDYTLAKSSSESYYLEDGSINPDKQGEDSASQSWQYYTLYDKEPIYVWDEDRELEVFYKAIHVAGFDTPEFELIDTPSGEVGSINFYHENYLIDQAYYGTDVIGRGWDSTVWQKVYVEDKEKYVMIAELNSVVPTFGITVDQPTLDPMTPHFDADSSSLYYNLHIQPNWGFRVAKYEDLSDDDKEKYGADTQILNSGFRYDASLKSMRASTDNYKGVIYYNKKGLDPNYRYDKSDKADEISVKNSGKTGYKYYDKHGVNAAYPATERADIQELYINLPSIGNAVTDLYNAVYGTGEQVGTENKYRRNKSMDWNSYSGERLIEAIEDGTGYEFSPDKIASVAGAVNSIHDLMGMIIMEADEDFDVDKAYTDHIYYKDGKFYIKDLTYVYDIESEEEYNDVTLADFDANEYYYKKGNNYYRAEKYQQGSYLTLDNINEVYLTDYDYQPNTFYYKNASGTYALDNSETPRETRNYYVLPEFEEQLDVAISNEKEKYKTFFFPSGTGSADYFEKFFTPSWTENSEGTIRTGSGLFKIVDGGRLVPYEYDTNAEYVTNLYWWENYTASKSTEFGTENAVWVYDQDSTTDTNPIKLTFVPFEKGKYFYEDDNGNYVFAQTLYDIEENKYYYILPEDKTFQQITGTIDGKKYYFYEPNKYYYKDLNNYLFSTDETKLKEQYYLIDGENEVNYIFYTPYTYYYKDDEGNFILDASLTFTPDREYYYYYEKYIANDNEYFNKGEKCNPYVNYGQFNGVQIGYRKGIYEWKELEGFARTLNTIHGLIIKINQILKADDTLTRDTSTVQGCINQLNDIIDKFETLVPNQLALVNQYGKIASGPASGDSWINITTDNGEVKLSHAALDKKILTTDDVTPQFGNTFTIVDYGFDDKGHKYAEGSHTVKIPAGSLENKDDVTTTDLNVVTNIEFTSDTGKITVSRTNIADLKIYDNQTLSGVIESINGSISAETEARTSADTALQANINSEATIRASADEALDGKITALESSTSSNLSTAKEDLEGKIATIQGNLDTAVSRISTIESDLSTAKASLSNKDTELEGSISTVNDALTEFKNSFTGELGDLVYSNTKFNYIIGEEESNSLQDIINNLSDYITALEARVAALEGDSGDGNEGSGGEDDGPVAGEV